jgi:curved DNA-binding protein CbpA
MRPSTTTDCYQILGLSKEAGLDDIKSSYRRLARLTHPDKDRDNPNATENFKKARCSRKPLPTQQR